MRSAIASLVVVAALTALSSAASEIQADLARLGPRALLNELYSNPESWGRAIAEIESGKVEWVRAALALYSVADAGAKSELHDALFAALRQQAALVLSSLPQDLTVQEVCSGRHDPLESLNAALAEQKDVETAVSALGGEISATLRSQCLVAVQSGKRDIQRFFGQ